MIYIFKCTDSICQNMSLELMRHNIIVKEWLYCKVFNEEFNLGFSYPRNDTYQLCDELGMAIADILTTCEIQHNELGRQLAEHLLKSSQAHQLQNTVNDIIVS